MSVSVSMPALGESVTEGTVTRWLKAVGDTVHADEPLLEVSTDKVDTEIPAPASGVLLEIKVDEDQTVDVGTELAVIGESADTPAPTPAPAPAPVAPEPVAAESVAAVVEVTPEVVTQVAGAGVTSIVLPALGESVTEGTVTRWLKAVGDTVQADEPLLEVSTDKVDTEIPAPASGVLIAINVAEDATVDVGTELGTIGTSSSAVPAPAPAPAPPAAGPPAPAAAPTPPPAAAPAAAAPEAERSDAYVTPLVRRLAAQHGIDLATVTGTGVGGRIRKDDVLALVDQRPATPAASVPSPPKPAAPAPATAPASAPAPAAASAAPAVQRGRTEKMPRLRKLIAERMVASLQSAAQLTTVIEVDVTRIAALRQRAKKEFEAREGVKLTFLPFFCKAAVEALKQYPQMNASVDMQAGTVTYHEAENLGIAVDTERGLLVPVVHDAGDLSIAGLARRIADLAERTRTNKLAPEDLTGSTFTVTNTGSRGALFDTPILNAPEVAILGTGAVVKRPIVISDNGQDVIAVRSMVFLALTYDHRLVDGADAARFLGAIKQRLEDGSFDAELGT